MASQLYFLLNKLATGCSGSAVNFRSTCETTGLPHVTASQSELQTVLQLLFGIIGAIAVLFVVVGGLRYTLSGGTPEDMSRAKNTIIYAVVGLLVVMFAEALVTFAFGFIK
jgi:hypothetical protein